MPLQDYTYRAVILGNETADAATNGVYHIVPGQYVPELGVYFVALRPYDPGKLAILYLINASR